MTTCYMDGSVELAVEITASPKRQILWWHSDRTWAMALRELGSDIKGGVREPTASWLDGNTLLIDYSRLPVRLGCGYLRKNDPEWEDLHTEYRGRCEPAD